MKLSTQTWGSGDRSILLLHGITSNAESWWQVGPALAELGFRVVAPDLRGHGHTHHSQDYRLASHATDVRALADHWEIVVGHSMGGAVALTAYESGWAGKIVLEDPALLLGDHQRNAIVGGFDLEPTPSAVRRAHPDWEQGDIIAKALALGQMDRQMGSLTWNQNLPWDLRGELAMVDVPTLVMAADPELDALLTPDIGAAATESNQNVTVVTLAGAGHSIHRDSYREFMESLEAFLLG